MWQVDKSLQAGKYKIIRCVGRGGFGLTYLSFDCFLKRQVVIKTPNRPLQPGQEFERYIRRFQREGQVLSKFSHPNIVTVLDFFQEENFPCLVMAYIEGETLEQYIRRSGPLSEGLAITTFQKISSALHLLHQEEIVHCDIHPGNIILKSDQEPVLIDFGSTKMVRPGTSTVTTTINESYAPYEQGKTSGIHRPSLDVYGLAATLYFTVTGSAPQSAIQRKLYGDTLQPPQKYQAKISDSLNQAILYGMALEAEERPNSIEVWTRSIQSSSGERPEFKSRKYFQDNNILPVSIEDTLKGYPSSQRTTISRLFFSIFIVMAMIGFFPQHILIGPSIVDDTDSWVRTGELVTTICRNESYALWFSASLCILIAFLSQLVLSSTQDSIKRDVEFKAQAMSSKLVADSLVAVLGGIVTFSGSAFVVFLSVLWPYVNVAEKRWLKGGKNYSWISSVFVMLPLTILGGLFSVYVLDSYYWESIDVDGDRFFIGFLLGCTAYIQWSMTYSGLKYSYKILGSVFRPYARWIGLFLIVLFGVALGLLIGHLSDVSLSSFLVRTFGLE